MREGGLPIGVRVAAGLAVGAALLGLLLWKAEPDKVWASLGSANLAGVVAVLAVHYASLLARVTRWRWLLHAADCAPPASANRHLVLDSVFFGWLGNLLLPARIGEIARPAMFARGAQKPFVSVLGTSVVERVADLAVVAAMAWFALAVLPVPDGIPEELVHGVRAAGALSAVALVGLLAFASRTEGSGLLARFRRGLAPLRDPAVGLKVFGATTVVWALEASCVVLAFAAFGFPVSLSAAICHVVAVTLSIAVVTVPAGLGVEQGVTVAVLAPWGIGMSDAIAMSIVLSFAAIACVVPGGLLAILRQELPTLTSDDSDVAG